MDEKEKQISEEELIKEAETQAREKLKGILAPEQLGYQGFLEEEMKKILKEKGIEWHKENKGVSVD